VGHVARMGEGRRVCRVLVERPEVKRPLKRPRCRWEDNIKTNFRAIGSMGRTGFGLLKISPVAGFCEHGNEPSVSITKVGCCLIS
jgi:hypothetical protein